MKQSLHLTVNGQRYELSVAPNTTLLEVLRDELHLRGVKEACGMGQCGSCTVLLDGKPIRSCITLALDAEDRSVTTIEGLAEGNRLHPLQKVFIDRHAFQCGFCTPGMILTAKALLDQTPHPSREAIIRAMTGNLCRCTGYTTIVEAVEVAAKATHTSTNNA